MWLDVNEAAALVGKSLSTIRRLIPEIEDLAPDAIRREPIEGKGGEKVLLSRAYLVERFKISPDGEGKGAGTTPPVGREEEGLNVSGLVEILERQLEAKDRQISALQREAEAKSRQLEQEQQNAAEFAEKLGQFAALNTSLQNKLLSLTERAGDGPEGAGSAGMQEGKNRGGRQRRGSGMSLVLL